MSFRRRIPDHLKREDEIQHDIVDFFRRLGCKVYETSERRRKDGTPGMFDLYLVLPCRRGVAWFDSKQPGEQLRPEQVKFADDHRGIPVPCGSGTLGDAHQFALAIGLIARIPGVRPW